MRLLTFCIILFNYLHSLSFCSTLPPEHYIAREVQKHIIWNASAPEGKQAYVVFRKTIDFPAAPVEAVLRVFADTRYTLWINGAYVERGPCRFDPKHPEYDVIPVTRYLAQGRNVIAILVHHYAINSFTEWYLQCARMMHHRPGLTARLDAKCADGASLTLETDESWKTSKNTRYLPSPGTYSSVYDNIDARRDDGDWSARDYNDSRWDQAVAADGSEWGLLSPRSIPLLREEEVKPLRLVRGGASGLPPGTDALRLRLSLSAGAEIIVDAGRVIQGYAVIGMDAGEGAVLEIDYASRFFETGGKPNIVMFGLDETPRTNRYITRAGSQSYMGGDTFGFRYLVIRAASGETVIRSITIIERRYPFVRLGAFSSSDSLLDRIWNVCVNTIEVCSEDAYVDCADRERAQWIADGYLVNYPVSRSALAASEGGEKYSYADPRLLRNMLRQMALGQLPDGRLQPMRPSDYPALNTHGVIDDYSCLWVQAVRELYDRTGDDATVRELWPVLVKTLDYFLGRRSERGLVRGMEFVYFNNPLIYKICEGATINAFIYRSLSDAAYLGGIIGDTPAAVRFRKAAAALKESYNGFLWNKSEQTYNGALFEDSTAAPTAHAALLALYYDLVPDDKYDKVFEYLLAHFEKEKPFPYTYRFFFHVLYRREKEKYDRLVLDTIRKKWAHMADYETQTTSED